MRVLGAIIGLLFGVSVVALHGAVEGFQGGCTEDDARWACAGSAEASTASASVGVTHPGPAALAFLAISPPLARWRTQ
jgi:hypothetical protein